MLVKAFSKPFRISNKLGLHARAAALFVKEASRYKADVFVHKGKKRVNGKSIMGLLMLAAGLGAQIKIEVDGVDGEGAILALGTLVEQGFYEK